MHIWRHPAKRRGAAVTPHWNTGLCSPRRLTAGFCALVALAVSGGCSAQTPSRIDYGRAGLLVRLPDHRKLNFHCAGNGAPLVLLESGFGADSIAWAPVQASIAATTRVCSYDRAGYGFSDPGPIPRDGEAIADDLNAAVKAMSQTGPMVVVGHSAGGLYVRLFAARRPSQVVAMVLLDPTVEEQEQRFARIFGPGAGSFAPIQAGLAKCLEAWRGAARPELAADCAAHPAVRLRTELSEIESLGEPTSREVRTKAGLTRHIPVLILTAVGPDGEASPGIAAWVRMHEELAGEFVSASQRQVRSSHLIISEEPRTVVEAIESVVAQERQKVSGKVPGPQKAQ